ncbi:MAG: HAD family hydrolase [Clostridia bacterium]|nr:HAD family hydrolase [Clostridia bacterium]
MYNIILFDLDGTLTDPGEGITNSVAYALNKFNINVEDKKELYNFIGPPLIDSFMKFYGMNYEDGLKAVEYYREYFGVTGIFENTMFDGIPELLDTIKKSGRKISLATSKPEQYAVRILEHFGLTKYFDFIGAATMDESRSKKADVITYTLSNLGVTDKSQVVMIGDRHHDIEGANQNGLDSIGVLFGYGDRKELETAGATYIVETIEDIIKFL